MRRQTPFRSQRRAAIVVATALACCAPSASAFAQSDDGPGQAEGRALFEEGMTLYNAGQWSLACPKFEASFRQYPGIGTRGKLAECYEKIGKLASAWRGYRDTSQLAMRTFDAVRAQIATERAEALEPRLARITVVVPADDAPPGMFIKRDGQLLERSAWGKAEPVDAGVVTFEFGAPNRATETRQVRVDNGQSIEVTVPELGPRERETEARRTTPAATPDEEAETPDPQEHEAQASNAFTAPPTEPSPPAAWQKPAGLVVAGIGVLGLATSGGFGLAANAKYTDAFDGGGCNSATNTCTPSGQQAVNDARSAATTSTIFAVAGAAFVVGGVVLYLTAPPARTTGLRVMPMNVGASGGGVTFAGSL